MSLRLLALIVTIAALLPIGAAAAPTAAQVARVVDGDTVDVQFADGRAERLRLIGMNTPETVDPRKPVQCFAREASAHAHELLDGQAVTLDGDPSQDIRDRYGRTLAYVWLPDGSLFNRRMIAEGFAHEYTYRVPYLYQADFKAAERSAREQQLGLWSQVTCNGNTTQAATAQPNSVLAQAGCTFKLGFKALRDLIPTIAGECTEDEHANPQNGDALQMTTKGLMAWRKADNWTAFTDGATTWINGPEGVASRPNGGPLFPWESQPTASPPAPAPAPAPPPPPPSGGFNPRDYIGKGDAFNCPDFKSQADAQAVLRADPSDPNRLDPDRDGIACENNPPPRDLNRVPR